MKNKDSQRNDGHALDANAFPWPSPSHPISGGPDDAPYDVPPFNPVPVQTRHDGRTAGSTAQLYRGWR
ncbi:MAG: hypothetical protein ABI668_11750 [Sphingorhabdus sp.]